MYVPLNLITGDVLTQARMAHVETQYREAVRTSAGIAIIFGR